MGELNGRLNLLAFRFASALSGDNENNFSGRAKAARVSEVLFSEDHAELLVNAEARH
jgi:hypothetical protein